MNLSMITPAPVVGIVVDGKTSSLDVMLKERNPPQSQISLRQNGRTFQEIVQIILNSRLPCGIFLMLYDYSSLNARNK